MRLWFLTSELIKMDGLPNEKASISQKANKNNWLRRKASGKGRAFEYHFSNFDTYVQKQLIETYGSISEIKDIDSTLNSLNELGNEDSASPSNVAKLQPVSEFSEWSELPVYDVHAAAGAGTLVHSEYQLETLMIPTSLISEFGLMATDASIIYVDGDSMEPTLSDKDRLLVDVREQQHPVPNGVYVIRIDDAIYVKRLKWSIANGVYKVISDNPEHESFEIDHNNGRNFKIIGKAVAPVFKKIF